MTEGRFGKYDEAADRAAGAGPETGEVNEIPVIARNVRWERPTMRSFWNALADPEREALAAAGGWSRSSVRGRCCVAQATSPHK